MTAYRPRQDPLRTASERLRGLLADPSPHPLRVELLQFLDLLEEHVEWGTERVSRVEEVQVDLIRLLHRLLRQIEPKRPELRSLSDHLDRLNEALEAV